MDAKTAAAEKAVEFIENGMTIGLGTGSTAYWAIRKIGEMVDDGLQIMAVASSIQSELLAQEYHIPLTTFSAIDGIDITIDGADEVDKNLNLIKGGGGALLREKILGYNSKKLFIIVDDTKLKDTLGQFPLPVEAASFAFDLTLKQLKRMQCKPRIRMTGKEKFITDNGNLIIDCHFGQIKDPASLDAQLRQTPGILETGLFLNTMVNSVIVGYADGTTRILNS